MAAIEMKLEDLTLFVPLRYILTCDGKPARWPSIRVEKAWRMNNVAALHAGILGCDGFDECGGYSHNLIIVTPSRCLYAARH